MESGFTLLEVIIAFAIAALALGVIVRTSAAAVQATRDAGRADEALARAASHIAAASAAPLSDSDREGDEGSGYHWEVRVAAAGRVQTAADRAGEHAYAVTLYRITVIMSWADGGRRHAVRLDSARLGPLT